MADFLVAGSEAVLPGRHADNEGAARSQQLTPLTERALVVLDVLKNLEGADQINAEVWRKNRDVARQNAAAARLGDSPLRHRGRTRVWFHADVPVIPC